MRILLTGGAGCIGSHTAVALVAAGHEVVCLNNLSNSRVEVMDLLEDITGQNIPLVVGDIRDRPTLEHALRGQGIEAVIHFAGLKAVGEAVAKPLLYYDTNVRGTRNLAEAMIACNVKTLVFSFSATVYGEPQYLPLDEAHPTAAANPYGRTKRMIEELLTDIAAADPDWRIAVLRYFNPVGAHESGLIGEDPHGIPGNLMPFISRAAWTRCQFLEATTTRPMVPACATTFTLLIWLQVTWRPWEPFPAATSPSRSGTWELAKAVRSSKWSGLLSA